MIDNRLSRWLVLVSALVVVAVLVAAVFVAAGDAPNRMASHAVDTATVSRLTRPAHSPASIQTSSDVTSTYAAMLASDAALNPFTFSIDLPVVTK
ncbi:MAG: hypothetical protein M1546_10420 [Chloroflexi bacterium]|nr:hypothetical protein [Chloroflexota bacterium]